MYNYNCILYCIILLYCYLFVEIRNCSRSKYTYESSWMMNKSNFCGSFCHFHFTFDQMNTSKPTKNYISSISSDIRSNTKIVAVIMLLCPLHVKIDVKDDKIVQVYKWEYQKAIVVNFPFFATIYFSCLFVYYFFILDILVKIPLGFLCIKELWDIFKCKTVCKDFSSHNFSLGYP